MIRILDSRRCSGIDGWPRQGRPSRIRPSRQRSLLRSNAARYLRRIRKRSAQRILAQGRKLPALDRYYWCRPFQSHSNSSDIGCRSLLCPPSFAAWAYTVRFESDAGTSLQFVLLRANSLQSRAAGAGPACGTRLARGNSARAAPLDARAALAPTSGGAGPARAPRWCSERRCGATALEEAASAEAARVHGARWPGAHGSEASGSVLA